MLKVTVATKTKSNITVSKDSVIDFDPYFKTERIKVGDSYKERTAIIYKNRTWGKAADYQDGVTPPIGGKQGVDFIQYGQSRKVYLTDDQMNDLENGTGEFSNVFQGVQNILIKEIEDGWGDYTGVGTGNVIYYKAIFS